MAFHVTGERRDPPRVPTADMQHEILARLHEDHINMAKLIELIAAALVSIERGESFDLALLEDALVYITAYPDVSHHPTEDVVFDRLGTIAPEAKREIDRLVQEHEQIIASGQALLGSIRAIEEEAVVARSRLLADGRSYIATLKEHMNKEESGLFRLAAERLDRADWDHIAAGVQAMEDPLFGPAVSADHRRLWRRITAHLTLPGDRSG